MRLSIAVVFLGLLLAGSPALLRADAYDPLLVDPHFLAATQEFVVHDSGRDRDIPVLVYLPATTNPAPIVLFSHGLGGTRFGSPFLGRHWAARGYAAVFVQHPGSDDSVWKDIPVADRLGAMQKAASLDNFLLRVRDVPAVINQLEQWNTTPGHPLAGRLDLKNIGMSGHSFGAVTTEALCGETLPLSGREFTDTRLSAALVLSPSLPSSGSGARAFGQVTIPWLLMTGTLDKAPIGHATVASRREVYQALKGAPKYELVLNRAEHSVFTDNSLPGEHEPRNPNHHRVILALSTAFWDAYLKHDSAALAWLQGPGPRAVMESADQWQLQDH